MGTAPPRRPAPAPAAQDEPTQEEWTEPEVAAALMMAGFQGQEAPIVFHLSFNGLPCDVPVYTPSEDGLRDFLIAQTDWLKSLGFSSPAAAPAAARPAPAQQNSGQGGYQRQQGNGGGGYQRQGQGGYGGGGGGYGGNRGGGQQQAAFDPDWICPEHGAEKVQENTRFGGLECGMFSDYQEDWTRDKPSVNRTTGNERWYCRHNTNAKRGN